MATHPVIVRVTHIMPENRQHLPMLENRQHLREKELGQVGKKNWDKSGKPAGTL
jgi:hypothetical protein